MQNFYRIATGIDVAPLVNALKINDDLWNQNQLRTAHPLTPHHQVNDIWLRFNEVVDGDDAAVLDDKTCVNYPAIYRLPDAQGMLFWLMARVRGEQLGRCIITELPPGNRIDPHIDMGAPATYYDRYHIVLACEKGCIFRADEEQVSMQTGEVWWFNNEVEHEVINHSADDRLTLIADIRCFR